MSAGGIVWMGLQRRTGHTETSYNSRLERLRPTPSILSYNQPADDYKIYTFMQWLAYNIAMQAHNGLIYARVDPTLAIVT